MAFEVLTGPESIEASTQRGGLSQDTQVGQDTQVAPVKEATQDTKVGHNFGKLFAKW